MSDNYYDKANENDSHGSQPKHPGGFGTNAHPDHEALAHASLSQTISRVSLRMDDLVAEPVENFVNVWMHYITNVRASMGKPVDPDGTEVDAMVEYLTNLRCQLSNLALLCRNLVYGEIVNGVMAFKYTEYGSQAINDANRLGFGSDDQFPGQAQGWANQPG